MRDSLFWRRVKFGFVAKLRDWGRQIDYAEKMRHVAVAGPIEGPGRVQVFEPGDRVRIGAYTSINRDVSLLLGERHASGLITTYPLHREFGLPTDHLPQRMTYGGGDIVIGCDVWIGYEAVVMSGVTIGHGAVVGARAVVTKDVPPYAIALGIPAKVTGYRYPADVIDRLLRVAWWDWPTEKIKANADLIASDRIDEFLRLHGSHS